VLVSAGEMLSQFLLLSRVVVLFFLLVFPRFRVSPNCRVS
jgi:hypothetical protein